MGDTVMGEPMVPNAAFAAENIFLRVIGGGQRAYLAAPRTRGVLLVVFGIYHFPAEHVAASRTRATWPQDRVQQEEENNDNNDGEHTSRPLHFGYGSCGDARGGKGVGAE